MYIYTIQHKLKCTVLKQNRKRTTPLQVNPGHHRKYECVTARLWSPAQDCTAFREAVRGTMFWKGYVP